MALNNILGGTSSYNGFEVFDSGGIKAKTPNFSESLGYKCYRAGRELNINIWKTHKTALGNIALVFGLSAIMFISVGIFSSANIFLFVGFCMLGLMMLVGLLIIFLEIFLTIIGAILQAVNNLIDLIKKSLAEREWQKLESLEWHACEHKLIYVLENGQEITEENIRNAPAYTEFCGCGEGDYQKSKLKDPSADKIMAAVSVGLKYMGLSKAVAEKK